LRESHHSSGGCIGIAPISLLSKSTSMESNMKFLKSDEKFLLKFYPEFYPNDLLSIV